MPKSKDCMGRDFSEYDGMSTQQLQKILREDASKSEGEGSDPELVFYVMELLASREPNKGKTPQEAWKCFKEQYNAEEFFVSETENQPRKYNISSGWRRGLVAAIAVVMILAGGVVTASALGIDLWEIVAKWSKETFYFGYAGQTDENMDSHEEVFTSYKGLYEATVQLGLEKYGIPTWLPEGYREAKVETYDYSPTSHEIHARYEGGDGPISILITSFTPANQPQIERSSDLIELYTVNDIEYYLFYNNSRLVATWLTDSYQYTISGPISVEEMKNIIDSIIRGEGL